MSIAIKVDEDLPGEISAIFNAAGHEALSIFAQRMTGTPDESVWPIVQAEKRCLVTADKGFGNIRIYVHGTHFGIVLFRLERESRIGYIKLTRYLLQQFDLNTVHGATVVVTPHAIRVRRSI